MKRILGYIKKVSKARFIKIFLIIVIVIVIGIFLPPKIKQIQDNKKYKQITTKIDTCINKKDYDSALKIVNSSIKKSDKEVNEKYMEDLKKKKDKIEKLKDNAEYTKYMAEAESEDIEVTDDDRIDAYTKAIDAKPEEDKAYIEAAQIYVQYNEYEKAVSLLSSGIEACEEEKTPTAKITSVKLSSKINEINDLMTNTEYNNKYLEALNYYKQGKLEEVELKYTECLAINRNDYRLYNLMAKAYFKESKYNEAIKVLNNGINRFKKIGARKKGSKLYSNYKKIVELRAKFIKIQETSQKYSKFYKKLLGACKKLKDDGEKEVIDVIASFPFATIAGCDRVTYYTSNGAFTEKINSGTVLAVYRSQYIYYGEWKNGKKEGNGYLIAVKKGKDNTVSYLYKGEWKNNYPNGEGMVEYKKYRNDKVVYYTKTKGNYTNGYEDGQMTLAKKKSSDSSELMMNYSAKLGEPVILTENGKKIKAADGTYVIGYYYDDDNSKKEIASIAGSKEGKIPKVKWRVQGLPYSK